MREDAKGSKTGSEIAKTAAIFFGAAFACIF